MNTPSPPPIPTPTNKQKPVPFTGHAIEARVYAEDPLRGFLPSTGQLVTYKEPAHLFERMEEVRV